MCVVTWLLTRTVEDTGGSVEINELYNAYQLEMQESGTTDIVSKRVFIDHINKVYPTVEKERRQKSRNSMITMYTGMRLKPVNMTVPGKVDMNTMKEILEDYTEEIKAIEIKPNSVSCQIDSHIKSNGNCVMKNINFKSNGDFELSISETSINLNAVHIANKYQSTREGAHTVIKAIEKLPLCEGVPVSKNVILTRFHVLENWTEGDSNCKRIVRTKLCNRVAPLNSICSTCIKCQKMTMFTKDNVKGKLSVDNDIKENIEEKSTETPISTNLNNKKVKELIPGATEEMVELFMNQANNANRDPRGRRWTEGMIKVCLQWYCCSPQSYESFRESQYLILPSKSTLIQYKNHVRQHVGFDDDIFLWMHEEAKRRSIPAEGYRGGIIIDEMSIQSDIQICKNSDIIELSGFTDVGEEGNICKTLRKGKNEKVLGTHALQFVFLGINGFRFPFAHFISEGVQAPQLYPLFWEAVDKLNQYGFTTVYTCMDGAQCNRTFLHINTSKEKKFKTHSPCTFGEMVFIMDCKHVIKKIRNNVLKSGQLKTSTRVLTLPSQHTIQWQMFLDCYKWDKTNAFQLHRKLTNEHMFPTNQQKMRNHLADKVLDADMLHVMLQYQQSLGAKGSMLDGVVEFLKHTSKLVEIFKDMRPIKSIDNSKLGELLKVAEWFQNWQDSMLSDASVSAKQRQKHIMSVQCHEDIQSCIIGFYELTKLLLEKPSKIFITPGLVNASQYRQALNSIILGQNTVSQKANAGKNKSAAAPYNCSLRKPMTAQKRKGEHTHYKKIKVIRM